jgi:hypothetical protein
MNRNATLTIGSETGAEASLAAVLIGYRTCNASSAALVHVEVPRGEGFVGVS